mgnify:CR=1 FL=1
MRIRSVLCGVLIAIVISAALIFITALLSYFTPISEGVSNVMVYIGAALGILLGAISAVRTSESKALFHAMSVSILFLVLLWIISFSVNGGIHFDMHFLAVTLGALLSGFLGAIIGR